ncbi:MAG TPA: PLP-dependent aminotransferase family protein, partial [Pyrinomonadaceae bacterium]|nr:PLP-dependent aminotransferase family protein [Pyrinomonadaceae bacterium]
MEIALRLDSKRRLPLRRQLYEELRGAILCGRLSAGRRIPSTRALANSLSISRTTVSECYEDLISEGYLHAKSGSGTFVSDYLPEQLLKATPAAATKSVSNTTRRSVRLSAYATRVLEIARAGDVEGETAIDFTHWRPAFDHLPLRLWRRLIARHTYAAERKNFDYTEDTLGYEPLREAIASYAGRSRAVRCEPSQVFICGGAQRAMDLITRVLVDPNDEIAIEDPGYLGARHIFAAQGAKLLPIPVDESGLNVNKLRSKSTAKTRFVYVSPSHQFPTGVLLSLSRRLELLSWAQEQEAFVIEDDYDSEYRYRGRPIPALQGLDQNESVIYVGTFSKVLFPSLRLGFVVFPQSLVEPLARAKRLTDRQSPLIEQCALADFINEGHLERHIRRMRTLYGERRRALVDALSVHLNGRASIIGDDAGMHLMARLETRFDDEELIRRAAQHGVALN